LKKLQAKEKAKVEVADEKTADVVRAQRKDDKAKVKMAKAVAAKKAGQMKVTKVKAKVAVKNQKRAEKAVQETLKTIAKSVPKNHPLKILLKKLELAEKMAAQGVKDAQKKVVVDSKEKDFSKSDVGINKKKTKPQVTAVKDDEKDKMAGLKKELKKLGTVPKERPKPAQRIITVVKDMKKVKMQKRLGKVLKKNWEKKKKAKIAKVLKQTAGKPKAEVEEILKTKLKAVAKQVGGNN
jgi:hypothetical protein